MEVPDTTLPERLHTKINGKNIPSPPPGKVSGPMGWRGSWGGIYTDTLSQESLWVIWVGGIYISLFTDLILNPNM